LAAKKNKLSKQQKKRRRELKKLKNETLSISDAVFRITNTFLQKNLAPGEKMPPMEHIVPFAIIGWNYSLLPNDLQEGLYDGVEDTLPPEIDAIGVSTVIELIDKFADEKRLLYLGVKRMIKEYKFRTDEFGEQFLDVTSVDIEDKN